MTDIGIKVQQKLATMSNDEQIAYSTGLSHAYMDVFEVFQDAFEQGNTDLHAVFTRISLNWDYVHNTQIVKGVL